MLHINTKNKSFLAMRDYLNNLKIKNNSFMLLLHNKELDTIDPYDDSLTSDQKMAIIEECFINPWYFIREVIRVCSDNEDDNLSYFELIDTTLMAIIYLCENNIHTSYTVCYSGDNLIVNTSSLCYFLWLSSFRRIEEQSPQFIKSPDINDENMIKLRLESLHSQLPDYIKDVDLMTLNGLTCKRGIIDTLLEFKTKNNLDGLHKIISLVQEYDNKIYNILYTDMSNVSSYYHLESHYTTLMRYMIKNNKVFDLIFLAKSINVDSTKYIENDGLCFNVQMYDMSLFDLKKFVHENSKNDMVQVIEYNVNLPIYNHKCYYKNTVSQQNSQKQIKKCYSYYEMFDLVNVCPSRYNVRRLKWDEDYQQLELQPTILHIDNKQLLVFYVVYNNDVENKRGIYPFSNDDFCALDWIITEKI